MSGSLKIVEASTGRARVARPDFPHWSKRGLLLASTYRTNLWSLAAWWNEGQRWSRQRTALVNDPTWPGPNAARMRVIAYVGRRMAKSYFQNNISFSHHLVVASLGFDTAMQFLQKALDKEWVVQQLKADVAANRQPQQPANSNAVTPTQLTKKYTTLVIDCPWTFDHPAVHNRIRKHYETLSTTQIMELPVGDLMTKDAYVFLWVPNTLLTVGNDVLKAWGFPCVANLAWCKQTKRLGGGNYWRNGHELLLLGVRGTPGGFLNKSLNSWLLAPPGRHSEKPDEVYRMIEKAVPGPYLEGFARKRRDGWDTVWSDEIR
jgi:N6-adenosine-specific RNA methylase IME4